MVQNVFQFETVGDDLAGGWPPVVLRAIVVLILGPSAVGKFVLYSDRAANFAEYGIPAPEITVLLVGVVQLLAVVTILAGAAGRLGALVTIPIMVTAMVVDAPNAGNVLVLTGCVGLVILGTGNYSTWEPFRVEE